MPRTEIHCPHCRKTTTWEHNDHRPFCSERCRLIDLGAWIDESYRVPDDTQPQNEESDENQF